MTRVLEPEAEDAFEFLQGHASHLHAFWAAFRKLYRGNEQSAPVLSAAANDFFVIVGKALPRTVFQMLRHLTDPPTSQGRENASFPGLLAASFGTDYAGSAPELTALVDQLKAQIEKVRNHTNRAVAHNDWLTVTRAETLQPIELAEVEAALATVRQFLDTFAAEFELIRQSYDTSVMEHQLDNLLYLLTAGLSTSSTA